MRWRRFSVDCSHQGAARLSRWEIVMTDAKRRRFLRNSGLAAAVAALGDRFRPRPAGAQTVSEAPAKDAAKAPDDVTRRLARFIVSARPEDLPDAVRHEARRT